MADPGVVWNKRAADSLLGDAEYDAVHILARRVMYEAFPRIPLLTTKPPGEEYSKPRGRLRGDLHLEDGEDEEGIFTDVATNYVGKFVEKGHGHYPGAHFFALAIDAQEGTTVP